MVPIYGVEKYIERFLHSAFGQTYHDIEYLFVDDCSKDHSMEIFHRILNEYPQRAGQVHVIKHDVNRGLAAARNTLLDHATGDYLMWSDPDDWLEKEAVEKCVRCVEQNDADFVRFGFFVHKSETEIIEKKLDADLISIIKSWSVLWDCFYRRDLSVRSGGRCQEGINFGEDKMILYPIALLMQKPVALKECLYHYNQMREDTSMTNSWNNSKMLRRLTAIHWYYHFFENKNEACQKVMTKRAVQTLFEILADSACLPDCAESYRKCRTQICQILSDTGIKVSKRRRCMLALRFRPLVKAFVNCTRGR